VNVVVLWRHKGRFEKRPQNAQPAGADVPYTDDTSGSVRPVTLQDGGLIAIRASGGKVSVRMYG
jgi:hypothetical protein